MEMIDKKIIAETYGNLVKHGISFNESLTKLMPNVEDMTFDRLSSICIALNHMGNARSKKESGFEFELANPRSVWESVSPEEEIPGDVSDYKKSYRIRNGKKVIEKSSSAGEFEAGSFKFRDVVDAFRKIAHARDDIKEQIAGTFKQSQQLFKQIDEEIYDLVIDKKHDLGAIKVAMVSSSPLNRKLCEAIIKESADYFSSVGRISDEQAKKITSLDVDKVVNKKPEIKDFLSGTKLASSIEKVGALKRKRENLKRLLFKLSEDKMFKLCKSTLKGKIRK